MNKCYLFAGFMCASVNISGMLVDTSYNLDISRKREIRQVDVLEKLIRTRDNLLWQILPRHSRILLKNVADTFDKDCLGM